MPGESHGQKKQRSPRGHKVLDTTELLSVQAQTTLTLCRLKKDVQHESFELSFIWGKMRTAAWEIAPQIALRNCAKEVVGKVSICDFGEGGVQTIKHLSYKRFSASHEELMSHKGISAFLYIRRCKDWGHGISS